MDKAVVTKAYADLLVNKENLLGPLAEHFEVNVDDFINTFKDEAINIALNAVHDEFPASRMALCFGLVLAKLLNKELQELTQEDYEFYASLDLGFFNSIKLKSDIMSFEDYEKINLIIDIHNYDRQGKYNLKKLWQLFDF